MPLVRQLPYAATCAHTPCQQVLFRPQHYEAKPVAGIARTSVEHAAAALTYTVPNLATGRRDDMAAAMWVSRLAGRARE